MAEENKTVVEENKEEKKSRTLEEQIIAAEKRVAELKARQRRREKERREKIGRIVLGMYDDVPDDADAIKKLLEHGVSDEMWRNAGLGAIVREIFPGISSGDDARKQMQNLVRLAKERSEEKSKERDGAN
jgi:hypothetical protein